MMKKVIGLSIAILCCTAVITNGEDFTYNNAEKWGNKYPGCKEGNQSPINIRSSQAKKKGPIPIKYRHFNQDAQNMSLKNTGDTILLRAEFPERPDFSYGSMKDPFMFEHISFHWGKNTEDGSEHAINGRRFSGEMQMNFYTQKRNEKGEYIDRVDRILIIAYLLKESNDSSNALSALKNSIKKVSAIGSETDVPGSDTFSLESLEIEIPVFYKYMGTVTQPPCKNNIIWIVNPKPIKVSPSVIELLRKTKLRGDAKSNVRPIQFLRGRKVSKYQGKEQE